MQSLSRTLFRNLHLTQRPATLALAQCQSAGFAKNAKEKATGDEKNFISKQEAEMLKNLAKKFSAEAKETPEDREAENKAELKKLFTAHGIPHSDDLVNRLLQWKFTL